MRLEAASRADFRVRKSFKLEAGLAREKLRTTSPSTSGRSELLQSYTRARSRTLRSEYFAGDTLAGRTGVAPAFGRSGRAGSRAVVLPPAVGGGGGGVIPFFWRPAIGTTALFPEDYCMNCGATSRPAVAN